MNAETILSTKQLAQKFVRENYWFPSAMDYMLIENAMMVAIINATETATKDINAMNRADVESRHESFQTPVFSQATSDDSNAGDGCGRLEPWCLP